jgi:hypothetical protein
MHVDALGEAGVGVAELSLHLHRVPAGAEEDRRGRKLWKPTQVSGRRGPLL